MSTRGRITAPEAAVLIMLMRDRVLITQRMLS